MTTIQELIENCADLLRDYLTNCLNEQYSDYLYGNGEVELDDRWGNVYYVTYSFEGERSREDGYREPAWLDVAIKEAAYWVGDGDEQLMTNDELVELEKRASIL